jgi:DNA-binding transcriptional LysR family regulator
MELTWLEDFLALNATMNFSKAALVRNVTQSTFSRRIQNLESWIGAPLVDRSTFPAALTEAGKAFRATAEDIVQSIYRERDQCKGVARPRRTFLSLSMLQTVAISFYPKFLLDLEDALGPLRTRVMCASLHDCIQGLIAENCDILLCYSYPAAPILLDGACYPSLCLSKERLIPVSMAQPDGRPMHNLDDTGGKPVPYLGYENYASFAGMVNFIFSTRSEPPSLDLCYESAHAPALKAMALAGHGVVWLPNSLVQPELDSGQLAMAGCDDWSLEIDIVAYRAIRGSSKEIERVWSHLAATQPRSSIHSI